MADSNCIVFGDELKQKKVAATNLQHLQARKAADNENITFPNEFEERKEKKAESSQESKSDEDERIVFPDEYEEIKRMALVDKR